MIDLSKTVGKNLAELRKARGLTQGQLAEKFAYTDKSVSKWEHGDALPDINVLKELANFYGVSLDYLTTDQSIEDLKMRGRKDPKIEAANKRLIIAMMILFVWTLAAVIFGIMEYNHVQYNAWLVFVWAFPFSWAVFIASNHFWGKKSYRTTLWIIFHYAWCTALYVELSVDGGNAWGTYWFVLFMGVPLMIATLLLNRIRKV
ncbi:MAG: helix-turn-helix domain-containing protein [Bacilli bacterium]|nr:helix-turn-helix domain-containing protein [Bacilli bacterium]